MGDYSDDFNAYSDGALSGNAAWEDSVNGLRVLSNEIDANSVGFNVTKVAESQVNFIDDHEAEIEFTSAPNNGDDLGVSVRITGDDGYATLFRNSTNRIYLYTVDNGVRTEITNVVQSVSLGDKLKLRCIGTTISVELDSGSGFTEVISETNTDYTTGQPAVAYNWGNVRATKGDNFIASDIGSGEGFQSSWAVNSNVML